MKKICFFALMLSGVLSAEAGRKDWKVGLQCWTFNHKSTLETIDYCADNGIKYLEIYPGQRLGQGFDGKSGHGMSAEECERLKVVLNAKGVILLSYGVVNGRNAKEWRDIFEFAKRMGLENIISEPRQDQMELLDELAAEYGIRIGIHNHLRPTPDEVAKRLEGRGAGTGIAPDNGHWTRAGIDNLDGLKRFAGRLVSIHLKDLNDKKEDVPYGEGICPIAAILEYLDQGDYKGPVIIEYESGNEEDSVRKCKAYLDAFVASGVAPSHEGPDVFVGISDIGRVFEHFDANE